VRGRVDLSSVEGRPLSFSVDVNFFPSSEKSTLSLEGGCLGLPFLIAAGCGVRTKLVRVDEVKGPFFFFRHPRSGGTSPSSSLEKKENRFGHTGEPLGVGAFFSVRE